MKNFAIVGAAGYIAPRHMKAIYDTGNRIVASTDPHDSVGILDRYDYDIKYFSEIERFDRHLYKLYREHRPVDYVSICSPNYLHDSHCRIALRNGSHAICEKPVVINPWNIDALQELEIENNRKVYPIMQMRYHPSVKALKDSIDNDTSHNVLMKYYAPRGNWYYQSWKGNNDKSGGLLMNIGVHMFDILTWLFGDVYDIDTVNIDHDTSKGYLYFQNTTVKWHITISPGYKQTRHLHIDGNIIDFSDATSLDLHTVAYQEILAGRGFSLKDALPSIELVRRIKYGDGI